MKRKAYGRDAGLSLRMLFTGALLGALYVGFAVVLFQVVNVGLVPMILIVVGLAFFQYYTSAKLALLAADAKVVSEQEAPDLHAVVAVTTGLWRRLEPQEIEGVLAHELSHVANRDVLVMTVASFFAMLAGILTRFGLYAGMFGCGRSRDSNGPP